MKKLLTIILSLFALNNSIVLANEIERPTPTSKKETIVETYEFYGNIADYETLIPKEITHNGNIYIKTDINVDEKTKTETLEISENSEKILEKNSKEKAITLFEKELNYDKDNLKGILKLDENSLNISKNEIENITNYETKKYTVYQDKTYYGLESNDYSLLPQTIIKNGTTLKLLTADFIKTNSKDTYNAECKYGGTYTKKIPTVKENVKNYKATATYKGTVTKEVVESRMVTVFYEKMEKNFGIAK